MGEIWELSVEIKIERNTIYLYTSKPVRTNFLNQKVLTSALLDLEVLGLKLGSSEMLHLTTLYRSFRNAKVKSKNSAIASETINKKKKKKNRNSNCYWLNYLMQLYIFIRTKQMKYMYS